MAKKKNGNKTLVKDAKKEKQLRKANKSMLKESGCTEEVDIDTILFQIAKEEDAAMVKAATVATTMCSTMGPRVSVSANLLPNGAEIVFFGGEYFNGQQVTVFNDIFRLNLNKFERVNKSTVTTVGDSHEEDYAWKLVVPPRKPRPRCSHQSVVCANYLYIFGGEFATKEQFQHFNDLWRLDLKTWLWEEVKTTGRAPSTRSGHRMTLFRGQLVVFGGFHDSFRETRYFNDLYSLNLKTFKWISYVYPTYTSIPKPRSGTTFVTFESLQGGLLFGGYQRVRERGVALNDSWWLDLKPLSKSHDPCWEPLSRKGQFPNERTGMGFCQYKQSVYVFGGVHDEELGPLHVRSMFFNDLFMFDAMRKRWFKIAVGKKKSVKSNNPVSQNEEVEVLESEESDVEEDNYDNEFVYIDQEGKLVRINLLEADELIHEEQAAEADKKKKRKEKALEKEKEKETEEKETEEKETEEKETEEKTVEKTEKETVPKLPAAPKGVPAKDMLGALIDGAEPSPRINPVMWTKGSSLYIYGGLVEVGKREVTLDDMWTLNLNTRSAWVCISRGSLDSQVWIDDCDDEEAANEKTESEDYYSDSDDEWWRSEEDEEIALSEVSDETPEDREKRIEEDEARRKLKRIQNRAVDLRTKIGALKDGLPEDKSRTPELGESLKGFSERTKDVFFKDAYETPRDEYARLDEKELRGEAFKLAQKNYYQCKPTLDALQRLYRISAEANKAEENRLNRPGSS
eukprot:GHVH01005076.1.p1 GENE.GHVH01005076.1~~GHVH01005076.1.p1  ORF type:complete len:740 (+),score=149.60 GHVH01005076.1:40-2259(+)